MGNILEYVKQKLYIILGFILLIVVISIIVTFINGGGSKGIYKTPAAAELALVKAAKEYGADDDSVLPVGTEEVKISLTSLVAGEYIKPIKDFENSENECDAYVTVVKSETDYTYLPHLICPSYETTSISDKVKSGVVTSGDGLYSIGNKYIFKGEYPNNYVLFAEKKWSIVSVDEFADLKLVLAEKLTYDYVWDNRYNSATKSQVGINDYKISRIKSSLEEIFDDLFTEENQKMIVSKSYCIGKSLENVNVNSNSECSEIIENQKIGLLTPSEFYFPSLAKECVSTNNQACMNYNYMSRKSNSWSITASSLNTYQALVISSNGIKRKDTNSRYRVYPTIYIRGQVPYTSGTGTSEDPYIIK